MNGTDILKLIGQPATLQQGKLAVQVRISDVKTAYGNIRYLVTPLSGSGSVWVDSSRVQLVQKESEII